MNKETVQGSLKTSNTSPTETDVAPQDSILNLNNIQTPSTFASLDQSSINQDPGDDISRDRARHDQTLPFSSNPPLREPTVGTERQPESPKVRRVNDISPKNEEGNLPGRSNNSSQADLAHRGNSNDRQQEAVIGATKSQKEINTGEEGSGDSTAALKPPITNIPIDPNSILSNTNIIETDSNNAVPQKKETNQTTSNKIRRIVKEDLKNKLDAFDNFLDGIPDFFSKVKNFFAFKPKRKIKNLVKADPRTRTNWYHTTTGLGKAAAITVSASSGVTTLVACMAVGLFIPWGWPFFLAVGIAGFIANVYVYWKSVDDVRDTFLIDGLFTRYEWVYETDENGDPIPLVYEKNNEGIEERVLDNDGKPIYRKIRVATEKLSRIEKAIVVGGFIFAIASGGSIAAITYTSAATTLLKLSLAIGIFGHFTGPALPIFLAIATCIAVIALMFSAITQLVKDKAHLLAYQYFLECFTYDPEVHSSKLAFCFQAGLKLTILTLGIGFAILATIATLGAWKTSMISIISHIPDANKFAVTYSSYLLVFALTGIARLPFVIKNTATLLSNGAKLLVTAFSDYKQALKDISASVEKFEKYATNQCYYADGTFNSFGTFKFICKLILLPIIFGAVILNALGNAELAGGKGTFIGGTSVGDGFEQGSGGSLSGAITFNSALSVMTSKTPCYGPGPGVEHGKKNGKKDIILKQELTKAKIKQGVENLNNSPFGCWCSWFTDREITYKPVVTENKNPGNGIRPNLSPSPIDAPG